MKVLEEKGLLCITSIILRKSEFYYEHKTTFLCNSALLTVSAAMLFNAFSEYQNIVRLGFFLAALAPLGFLNLKVHMTWTKGDNTLKYRLFICGFPLAKVIYLTNAILVKRRYGNLCLKSDGKLHMVTSGFYIDATPVVITDNLAHLLGLQVDYETLRE